MGRIDSSHAIPQVMCFVGCFGIWTECLGVSGGCIGGLSHFFAIFSIFGLKRALRAFNGIRHSQPLHFIPPKATTIYCGAICVSARYLLKCWLNPTSGIEKHRF